MLLGLVLFTLGAGLLLEGYLGRRPGLSGTHAAGTGHPGPLAGAGPVLDLAGTPPRSVPSPDRTVALTFEDGPDPRWTPAVLEVLRRHGVPATFFVVGRRAADHPGLVRRTLDEGHEVGVHTFTHSGLAAVPGWRANLELSMSQTALGGAAGVHTALLRPPYSSSPADVTEVERRAAGAAARRGYLLVLADRDGKDWRRPGVESIVADSMPEHPRGAVVLLHDGGGDRSQTVAAVERLVPELAARQYRFTTMSQLAGVPPGRAVQRVQPVERLQGGLLLAALRFGRAVRALLGMVLVPIAALALARFVLVVTLARHAVRRAPPVDVPGFLPSVSVLVPAYNEAVGIAQAVRSLVRSDYPHLDVVVVDDGSTDGTAEVVEALGQDRVSVIRQDNRGKAAALNTGIAHSSGEVVVMVDADTVFAPDTVRCLVAPFADPEVGAVSGNAKVGNPRRLLGRWQHLEYVMGFNLDRRMFHVLGCIPTVPGAVGAFRRRALDAVGGVGEDTLAEDTDLTMTVNRAGWRVVYEPSALAWTEAPATLGGLWRQRYRWAYGTMQTIWKHRGALREGGSLGRFGLPYLVLFQVALPLLAPFIDLFALYGLLFSEVRPVVAYWLGFNAVQLVLVVYALRLDGESLRPIWALPLQQFVYRQLMYLVVVQSVTSAVLGTRLRWHKLARTGDVQAPA